MKKLLCFLLVLALVPSFAVFAVEPLEADSVPEPEETAAAEPVGSLSNFSAVNEYADGMFADVDAGAWYAKNVSAAYALDLMVGYGDTFRPVAEITLAETVALAARIHSVYYTGSASFPGGAKWYDGAVAYAQENGILSSLPADFSAAATRREFAEIFARALPETELPAVNTIADDCLPDVKMRQDGAAEIYRLYRAGIVTGTDETCRFSPKNTITRAEAAALMTRMIDPSLRVLFSVPESTGPVAPEQDWADDDFFANTALLGNSLVQGLWIFRDKLPTAAYYQKESTSVYNTGGQLDNLCYSGRSFDKVYIEYGINEIGSDLNSVKEAYTKILDRISAAMPGADLYIMAVTPVTKAKSDQGSFTMKRINEYNEALKELASDYGCYYLDCCTPLEDADGYLKPAYAGWDGSPHLSTEGYYAWFDVIRTHYFY